MGHFWVPEGVWDPILDDFGGCQNRPKRRFCQKRGFWDFPEKGSKRRGELSGEMRGQRPKMSKNPKIGVP